MFFHCFLTLLIFFLWIPSITHAGSYYLRGFILGQGRIDLKDRQEFPMDSYVGAGYKEKKWRTETNLHIFRDWEREWSNLNLYETSVYGKLFENHLEIKAGRQFFTPGFNAYLMDGMKMDWNVSPHWGVGIYAGMPQYPETGDLKQDNGLLSGLQIFWQKISGLTGNTSVVFRRKDFDTEDWIENDQLSVANYLVYDLKEADTFRAYSGFEYQISGKTLEQLKVGTDWHPKRPFAFNFEFNLADANRKEIKDTLTALHSDGRTYQGRFGGRQKFLRDIEIFENYTLGRVIDPATRTRHSHQLEIGMGYFARPIETEIIPSYHFTKSYGGKVHAAALSFEKQFGSMVSAVWTNHYAQFYKITHDNGKAFSTILWTGWHIIPQWTIGVHLDFLKNNDVEKELRGGFLVQWGLGKVPVFPTTMRGVLTL